MLNRFELDRRRMMQTMGAGLLGTTCARWLPAFAAEVAADPRRTRHCILLWMGGGPSQMDTFDMKPGHANGGEFKEIATAAAGLRFTEHLPSLAKHAERLAVVRSLSTKEGDHARGTQLVRTGHPPMGEVAYPSIACSLAKQLEVESLPLPSYVSVAPLDQISPAAFGPGFLGSRYAPAIVGRSTGGPPINVSPGAAGGAFAELKLENVEPPPGVDARHAARRMELWNALESRFLENSGVASFEAHHALYRKAADMMRPELGDAFNLSAEPDDVRRKYGVGQFGQGCLLARRLVEHGVPFVEVGLGQGRWDTHADNFKTLKELLAELDAGWSTLMTELGERGLLDSTTILWMGEFGRTPQINGQAGRDHFPAAWSCVFAGGGIAGGQAYGRTSADGTKVEENPTAIGDVLATLSTALGVPPDNTNETAQSRPIKIAEGTPIQQILS
jgi:uncharacterized protein (DUF1501 family)